MLNAECWGGGGTKRRRLICQDELRTRRGEEKRLIGIACDRVTGPRSTTESNQPESADCLADAAVHFPTGDGAGTRGANS